jgi:hypothetical protein
MAISRFKLTFTFNADQELQITTKDTTSNIRGGEAIEAGTFMTKSKVCKNEPVVSRESRQHNITAYLWIVCKIEFFEKMVRK